MSFTNLELAQHAFLIVRRSATRPVQGDAIDELELYVNELEKRMEEASGYLPNALAVNHWYTAARYYATWQFLAMNPEDARAAENARRNYEDAREKWFRSASVEHNYDYFNDFNNRRRMQFSQPNLSDDEESAENEFRWDENNISPTEDVFSKSPVVDDLTASASTATPTSVFDPSTDASDPEGFLDVTSVEVKDVVNGTATVNATTGVITFTSDAAFTGTALVTAKISDDSGKDTYFKITITVS